MSSCNKVLLIWFDSGIGCSTYWQKLKKLLANIFVPEWSESAFLDDTTIDKLVEDSFSQNSYKFENSIMELHAVSNAEEYIEIIELNKDKYIFFIASDSPGEHFAPQIVKKILAALRKPADDHSRLAYVYFNNSLFTDQLGTAEYSENMRTFTCEQDFLRKFVNDIVHYFFTLGQKQYDCGTVASINQSLEYFNSAKILLTRTYGIDDMSRYTQGAHMIDKEIAQCETALRYLSSISDIDRYILCTETEDTNEAEMFDSDEQVHLDASSFPVSIDSANVERSSPLPESARSISSIHNQEKCLPQSKQISEIRVYLHLPSSQTDNFIRLRSILNDIFATSLVVISEEQEYYKLVRAKNSSVIVQSLSTDDDKLVLEKICSLAAGVSLYLLESSSNIIDDKQDFFTRYPQVRVVLQDPEELAIKIALDVILNCRTMADRYAQRKDKDHASKMYDQCIGLVKQLNIRVLKNMENRQ